MKTENLTYHNDPKFKRAFVRETRWHRGQDKYIRGNYNLGSGDDFKGCSVGCSINSLKRLGKNSIAFDDHAGLANLLGWPEWLCRLQDTIFEGLPKSESAQWTEQLAAAVPVGKTLDEVKWKFCAFLMRENIERVLVLTIEEKLKQRVISSIRAVLKEHENAINSGVWNESAASLAARAAESAASLAARAAESAAESAAAWAARSAAWAAESAAWAAESAAWSAAWSAWSAHTRYSKELLRLLTEVNDKP